jgi:hypothetical protein
VEIVSVNFSHVLIFLLSTRGDLVMQDFVWLGMVYFRAVWCGMVGFSVTDCVWWKLIVRGGLAQFRSSKEGCKISVIGH